MKAFLRFVFAPTGVALVIVHWLVVAYAFLGDQPDCCFVKTTYLQYYLAGVNILPLMFANGVFAVIGLDSRDVSQFVPFLFLMLFCVTAQWLAIGAVIEEMIKIKIQNSRLISLEESEKSTRSF